MAKKPNVSNLPSNSGSDEPPNPSENNETENNDAAKETIVSGEETKEEATESPALPAPRPPEPVDHVLTLDLPLRLHSGAYPKRFLNVRLTDRQANALVAIRMAADRDQAMLRDGTRVVNAPNTIRYLLEMIADAMESQKSAD